MTAIEKRKKEPIEPYEFEVYERFCDLRAEGLTLAEIAKIIDRAVSTLKLWKKRSDYGELVRKYRMMRKPDDLIKADKCVRNNLEKDNLKAAELVYRREGELRDSAQVNIGISLTDIIEAEEVKKDEQE